MMSDRNRKLFYIGLAVFLMFLRHADADISFPFTPVTWETGDTLGWVWQGPDAGEVTNLPSGGSGNGGGFLGINFPSPAVQPPPFAQYGSVENSGSGYRGDYRSPDLRLKFDLIGYTTAAMFLYFISSGEVGGASKWTLALPRLETNQTWQSYVVDFQNNGDYGWHGGSDLLAALSQVDAIGLIIENIPTGCMTDF